MKKFAATLVIGLVSLVGCATEPPNPAKGTECVTVGYPTTPQTLTFVKGVWLYRQYVVGYSQTEYDKFQICGEPLLIDAIFE